MTLTKDISIDGILEKLDKGERIGIDDAEFFLKQSKKLFFASAEKRFFESAERQAKKNPSPIPYQALPYRYRAIYPTTTLESLTGAITAVSASLQKDELLVSFSPKEVLSLSAQYGMKVTRFLSLLSDSGLKAIEGTVTFEPKNLGEVDDYFSVLMQAHRLQMHVTVQLPLTFTETEKIHHLAKIREFEDRTRSILFLAIILPSSFREKEVLKTLALSRVMLDNLPRIGCRDFSSPVPEFSASFLSECQALGLNLVEG